MLALTALLPASALTRYDEHGEPSYTATERVLMAMRRLDWATATEILLALDVEPVGRHFNEHQAISRLVKTGRVLSRDVVGGRCEYRLNPEAFKTRPVRGRAAAKSQRASRARKAA